MAIVGPIQRLVRKEPNCRRTRHDEVDEFSALETNQPVEADDDEREDEGPNE
jgi:hypothetical protein